MYSVFYPLPGGCDVSSQSGNTIPSSSTSASGQIESIDVDGGLQVKSNKHKEASSPIPLNKLDKAMIPTPRVNSFKEFMVVSLDRGAS